MLVRSRPRRIESLPHHVVSDNAPLLEVRNLARRFGTFQAVADVSLTLGPGEILGLLGPNGAGKSTTMLMISGLLTPDTGEVRISSQPVGPQNLTWRRSLGFVPQDLALYPELNAVENLKFFGRLYGLTRQELADRVDEILRRIGLTESALRPSGTYSGGMKRRLNFGIALMHRPSILILDEPTVGVDPQSRSHLLECVRDQAREGVGIIYASHYMEEVQSLCERVAIMDHGQVLACDSIGRLLARLETEVLVHIEGQGDVGARLSGLARIERRGEDAYVLVISGACEDVGERLRSVLHHLAIARLRVSRIETQQTNLERLFLRLTGYGLRD